MPSRSSLLLIFALLVRASPSVAQQFAAGIKVGGQTTGALAFDPEEVPFSPSFDHVALGPQLEVPLPHGLGLEFDALHKHYAYGSDLFVMDLMRGTHLAGNFDTHISLWEFPLMLKWRPGRHRLFSPLSPFVAGGLAQRHTDVIQHTTLFNPTVPPQPPFAAVPVSGPPEPLVNTWTRGPVVGGGLEYSIKHLRIAPEIRYTHWTQSGFGSPRFGGGGFDFQTNPNQLELLLGLGMGSSRSTSK
jgi:hypothetical protein